MADGGQKTAESEDMETTPERGNGADPGHDWHADSAADPGAAIDERLVEQALAGAWYHDPKGTPETRAAARAAQEALVRGMMAGLGPRDMSERIWAQQTTAAHLAAADAFKWLAETELPASGRVQVLRLAAQLMTVTGRQLASLDLHRVRRRAEAEAERRAAAVDAAARQATARQAAARQATAQPSGGGVLVVPRSVPPEVEAERMAEAYRARRRAEKAWREGKGPKPEAGPDPDDPYVAAAAKARAEGRGPCLLVPGKLSEEEWTRAARIYQRALQEDDP